MSKDKEPQTLESETRAKALQRIEEMRQKIFYEREAALRKRDEAVARLQNSVVESRKIIQARQDLVKNVASGGVQRNIGRRLRRGIDDLEKIISQSQIMNPNSDLVNENLAPLFLSSVEESAKEIIKTEFFQSLLKQVKKPEAQK